MLRYNSIVWVFSPVSLSTGALYFKLYYEKFQSFGSYENNTMNIPLSRLSD